jgi:hypothetical protein
VPHGKLRYIADSENGRHGQFHREECLTDVAYEHHCMHFILHNVAT